jgi:hypothetical protein
MILSTKNNKDRLDRIEQKLEKLLTNFGKQSADVKKFNDRFTNYRACNSMGSTTCLHSTLIASATITVSMTAVLRRYAVIRIGTQPRQAVRE